MKTLVLCGVKEYEFLQYLVKDIDDKIFQLEMEKADDLCGVEGDSDVSDMIQDECYRKERDVVRDAWNLAIARGCKVSTVERVFTSEFEYYL